MKCLREVMFAVWVHGYGGGEEDVASFCLRG